LILPHDTFKRHLDKKGFATNPELEKDKFDFTGKTLTEIWSKLILDGFSAVAEYIESFESEPADQHLI